VPAESAHPHAALGVLIVDDEPRVADRLQRYLSPECNVAHVQRAESLTHAVHQVRPLIVVVNPDLFDAKPSAICKRLRDQMELPFIVVSRHYDADQVVQALDGSAEDFLAKPHHIRELAARIKVVLRTYAPSRIALR
jgi:DNA-binding response OmpR family regulator